MAKKLETITLEMEDERTRMAQAGLMWLYELELINSSTLQNNLYMNLYAFPHVSDVEMIIDRYQRKILIWIKFTWITRKFLKGRRRQLKIDMLDQLQGLLPSFEFRIVEDRALFDLALKRMEQVLFGGKSAVKTQKDSEVAADNSVGAGSNPPQSEARRATQPADSATPEGSEADSPTNRKE